MFEEGVGPIALLRSHGVWVPRFRGDDRPRSVHLFVSINAPQPLLLDKAVEAIAGDATPAGSALPDLGHGARLQAGGDRTGRIRALVKRGKIVPALHGDHGRAPTRQQRVIDPAFGAFGIANPAPV